MEPDIDLGASRRIILHLDMESFYASVEMRERPELREKPHSAYGQQCPSHRCSFSARTRYSFHRFSRYVKASADVMTILKSYGFILKQVSIDEAFLDVSRLGTFTAATDLAVRIKYIILIQL